MPAKRILVVEDNAATREALALILEGSGYEVQTAAHGRAALDHLQTGQRPDLILLDLMMPVMDGWQFRVVQRSDADLAGIPVIVCTAASEAQRRSEILGAVAYLSKPVEVEDLLHAIERSG
jgi:CheY-like chemotaxis protein